MNFGMQFQNEMIALMLQDIGFAGKVCEHVDGSKLNSSAHQWLFNLIKEKIKSSGTVPSFIEIEDRIKEVDRNKRRVFYEFAKSISALKCGDSEFMKRSLTAYARRMRFVSVFQKSQELYNSKQFESAFDFTLEQMGNLYGIDFSDSAPITLGEFESFRQRMLKQESIGARQFPTMIEPLDDILRGGLSKGELGLILGEAKRGKSFGLIHMGAVALSTRRSRIAHFVLEGTTEQTILRYQSRLSGIEYSRLEKDEITTEEQKRLSELNSFFSDNLEVVAFNQHWAYTVLDIQNKIVEMERRGRKPDLVLIDYADLLKSHQHSENKLQEQVDVYRYVKQLAMMKDIAIWSATQAQRPKNEPDKEIILRSKDIADCFERVRIADLVVTLNQTPKEKLAGILRMHIDLYRSSDADKTIYMICDFSRATMHKTLWGQLAWIPPSRKKAA